LFEQELDNTLRALGLNHWLPGLHALLQQRLSAEFHGDFTKWQAVLQQLPPVTPSTIDLNSAAVRVGQAGDLTDEQRITLEHSLRQLHPWRKGPFELFGIHIDTEWRSDWKWDRLIDHITPLTKRAVLDIGCGSGYHCWRMRGAGAQFVLGIDPTLLFVMQYAALQHFIRDPQVQVLPLGMEDMPTGTQCFDTVFSMGLLYHRRDPQQHLLELRDCLREGGELILETLVIDERHGEVLVPDGRYAQMRNVWAIPSVPTLIDWITLSGFTDVRCVDVTITSMDEQRRTEWMQFQSLSDYLDPHDPGNTVEGYPAPTRAICIATK
jgi:tRNA (mo5U34)-methyltransferase